LKFTFRLAKILYSKEVNPVRNSSGALNPAGIILRSNPAAEQRGIISNGVNLEAFMQITRISPKHQITIPKEAFEKLRLEVGDFLEVDVTEEGLLIIPKKLISKDQAWFWTKEWQQKEKEADEAIAKGDVSGPFKKADDLIRHLRKRR